MPANRLRTSPDGVGISACFTRARICVLGLHSADMFAEAISRLSPRSPRLQSAAARVLGDRRLLWGIVGLVAVQTVLADLPIFLQLTADGFASIRQRRQLHTV